MIDNLIFLENPYENYIKEVKLGGNEGLFSITGDDDGDGGGGIKRGRKSSI